MPRVLHSGDKTGATIQHALTDALAARGRIPVLEHRFLIDLLTHEGSCVGALLMDSTTGELEVHYAPAVVLATGGAGQVFPVTTNPAVATGDGIAAAWRAGATVADMEFVQFHPTALDHDAAPRFLVSEALRGEGAYLLDCDLQRFMLDVHPLAELAPRDVVSREIERVMRRCRRDNVWLDARHLGEARLRARFPTIWKVCAEAGYDLSRDLVPVAPAAHYMVGGVLVDIDGRTTIPGLYASGEVAASGLHGANRLASNSLLEGLVFSRRIARVLPEAGRAVSTPHVVAYEPPCAPSTAADDDALGRLHSVAGAHLGMGRSAEGLADAVRDLERLEAECCGVGEQADVETANLITTARLIATGAAARHESRGCHYRTDFPERDDANWLGRVTMSRTEGLRIYPVRAGGGAVLSADAAARRVPSVGEE